ncbi:MAG TPA: efflux RND transporter periplasmic adaptor subunit [Dongiaceae bacterium]|nr:efflux RND transporter periplasmic adaptor subunit [Dongiaceae bacterium]
MQINSLRDSGRNRRFRARGCGVARRMGLLALATAASLGLSACGKPEAAQSQAAALPEVGIMTVKPQRISLTTELPGRVSAFLVSEVRPQVGGIIQKRLFEEGSDVKAGQVLYQIDPATYRATYDNAAAALAKAKATVLSARSKAQRYKELVAINAVSKQDYDDAVATQLSAEADIAADQASLESARINLDYTKVTAPISGRIGKSAVTPGALVTASQSDVLAKIQQLDQIYVDVTQSSAEVLRLKRDLASGKLVAAGANQAKVTLMLEDGSHYDQSGVLQFADITVDETTGSITLRAVFPNPKFDLLPGMYVRAVLEEGVNDQALLVPQRGVSRDIKGNPTALVIGADDKVEQRVLKTERTVGDQWLISAGLKPGDRLVLDGLQKIHPGSQVKPVALSASEIGGTPADATQQ